MRVEGKRGHPQRLSAFISAGKACRRCIKKAPAGMAGALSFICQPGCLGSHLLGPHVVAVDASHRNRLLHRVAAEGLAKLLVQHHLDEGGLAVLHLCVDGGVQRVCQLVHAEDGNALEAAGLGDAGIGDVVVELGADEIVIEPQGGVALLGAPLIVAEDDHGDRRPLVAADSRHFVHRDAEGAITGETDNRQVRTADLCTHDRRQAVAARAEQAGGQIFAAFLEGRVGVADGAVVADVGRDDGLFRKRALDRTPCHARRHLFRLAGAGALVPGCARIVVLMVHRGQFLRPCRLGGRDHLLAGGTAGITGIRAEFLEQAGCYLLGVAEYRRSPAWSGRCGQD